jgi:hypothetical protein
VTTFDHTRTAICDAIIDGVTFEKSENIFKHCGYIHQNYIKFFVGVHVICIYYFSD